MTKRSVLSVVALTLITFGIYAIVWTVKTKREMVKAGADIPTSWLLLVPFVGIYYMWKWSGGVEHVTGGKFGQAITFVMIFLLGVIGMAIVQAELNKASERTVPGQLPLARAA